MSRILPLLVLLTGTALAAVNVKSGAAIYTANCAGCHGAKAQGNVGPNLHEAANWAPPIFARAMLKYVDDKGVPLKAPMPNWGKVGFQGDKGKAPTTAEIANLQAYLKTLK
ncbi:c-type cytochrome [Deinococcus sp.]|uniref:c-type cytochrome n=1 Tax=Deinococcus sp. TaxID=47478 RepID=UPI003C7C4576